MKLQHRPITILGGMGPQASGRLYELLISASLRHPKASDQVFPHIVLRSLEISDFISDRSRLKVAADILRDEVNRANHDKSLAVAIACNTAHVLENIVVKSSQAPFVSLIEAVADVTARNGAKTVGLLASPTTIRTKLYKNALSSRKIQCIEPNRKSQAELEAIIRAVLSNRVTSRDKNRLKQIAEKLQKQGAESIILGCTELPLIFPKNELSIPVLDSLEILAERLINIYYQ